MNKIGKMTDIVFMLIIFIPHPNCDKFHTNLQRIMLYTEL